MEVDMNSSYKSVTVSQIHTNRKWNKHPSMFEPDSECLWSSTVLRFIFIIFSSSTSIALWDNRAFCLVWHYTLNEYVVWVRDTPGDVNAALATACTFILELIKCILGNVVNH